MTPTPESKQMTMKTKVLHTGVSETNDTLIAEVQYFNGDGLQRLHYRNLVEEGNEDAYYIEYEGQARRVRVAQAMAVMWWSLAVKAAGDPEEARLRWNPNRLGQLLGYAASFMNRHRERASWETSWKMDHA
jgi:hypothetical protein